MNKLLKTKLIVMTMAMTMALAACSGKETAPPAPAPAPAASAPTAAAKSASVVKVGVSAEYRPYAFAENNNAQGLEIDILQKIADKQGFTVEFVPTLWNVAYKEVQDKKIDIVAMGIAQDEADANIVVPTDSYMRSGDCLVHIKETTLPDWTKGKIGVLNDEGMEEELMSANNVKESQIMKEQTNFLILSSLVKKSTDVAVGDCTALKFYAKSPTLKDYSFDIAEYVHSSQQETSMSMVLMVSKDKPELLQKINTGLAELKKSGELNQIIQKYM
ncbi:substrate-binding periplasmic protein [Kingella kingae]|uniref:substrate-binding periplasmic protein n=1 Tax=Kingella kingae TaxID=504 RepID=UPI0003FCBB1F|nr:transporter substrate-binding domain-containing protein [Kingella kingae]